MNNSKSNKFRGIVVALKANFFIVEIDNKDLKFNLLASDLQNKRLLCTRRSKLDYQGLFIDVGDRVCVDYIDWKNERGLITNLEPRQSLLNRPAVANVTLIAVCISVEEPLFDLGQTSRFLITAEDKNINIVLVLTKIDLIGKEKLNSYKDRLKRWGYNPIAISVKDMEGIDLLLDILRHTELSVLCGPSGVGKTSLINHLIPNLALPTSSVSKKLKRGINTTRHVELFSVGNGSLVADTPGFNRPEIVSDPLNFAFLFPELRDQLMNATCKFRNCLHRDEPGCVINKDLERYSFYRENIEEMINSQSPFQVD